MNLYKTYYVHAIDKGYHSVLPLLRDLENRVNAELVCSKN